MRPWYCVQTQPNQELPVKQQLERQGMPAFAPIYLVKLANRHIARRLLFRNYVFVSLDNPAHWPRVKNTIGVLNVLTCLSEKIEAAGNLTDISYRVPSDVGSAAIESLRKVCLSYDEVRREGKPKALPRPPQQLITEGCFVRVMAGMFKDSEQGQRALVEWSEHDRAQLVLELFGRKARIEFYHHDLTLVP